MREWRVPFTVQVVNYCIHFLGCTAWLLLCTSTNLTVLKILWTSAFNSLYEKRSDQQLMIRHSKFCLFNVATALQDGYRAMNTYSDCLGEARRRSGGEQGINSMYKDNSVMSLSSNTTLFESRMRTDSITCKKTYKTQPLFLQKWSETFHRQGVLNLVIWVLKTETKDKLITQTSSYRLYTKYLIYHKTFIADSFFFKKFQLPLAHNVLISIIFNCRFFFVKSFS